MNTRSGGRPDIDDIDDVDVLETYDWNDDPWDASLGVSEVEPVRGQTRAAKWVGYGALALANVLIIAGGIYGWWYIRQANAPGDVGGPVEFVIAEGETSMRSVPASRMRGSSRTRRSSNAMSPITVVSP